MGARILLVDDEEQIHEVVRLLLEKEGYELRGALGEEDAVLAAKLWKPDLILLDITLEHTTGFALLPLLREVCPAPILFFTGFYNSEVAKDAELLGVPEVLTKPVDLERMLEALRTHLSH